MREKRSRNRRILFLALAVLFVLSLVIGECCLLVRAATVRDSNKGELFATVQVALARPGAPD